MKNTNNFIFKRTLNLFAFRDKEHIQDVFKTGGLDTVSRSQIDRWKNIKDENKKEMPDKALIAFFDGLDELSRNQQVVCYHNLRGGNE